MRRPNTRRTAAAAFVLAAALLSVGTSAEAAKPPRDGRIAYTDNDAGRVATVNPDGSAIRSVTPPDDFSFDQAWSPDGSRLVFASDHVGDNIIRLFTIRRDGTGLHQVTGDSAGMNDQSPTFTPDGAGIVYTRCRPDPPGGCALAFVRTNGTGKKMLTAFGHDPADFFPDVSPNGRRVAFTRFGAHGIIAQVWVMRIDGTHAHPVTRPGLEAATPTWTRDGNHLLVTSLWVHLQENVYRLRADGSHLERLTHSRFPHNAFFPSSSPSGSRIAYADDRAYPDLEGADLMVMKADGSNRHAILSGMGALADPDWGTAPLVNGGGPTSSTKSGTRAVRALPARVTDVMAHSGYAQRKRW
jgi:Tol biopolymer transport system component